MRYAAKFACTCKEIVEKVNSSEEDHVLFFKEEISYQEYRLLCSLKTQLKAFNNIDFRYRSDEDKPMYLWIKKDKLEKTLTALGIESH